MEYVLKHSEKHTTKYRLTQYFYTALTVGVLFTLCTLCFHIVATKQYDITIEQSLSLNQFYMKLDQLNVDITSYWQDNLSVETGQIFQEFEELDQLVDGLKARQINEYYSRNIYDIREIMDSYEMLFSSMSIQMNALNQDKFNTTLLSKVNEIYSEMEEIYEILYSDFTNLHLTMLENTRQIQENLRQKTLVYAALLGIALILLVFTGIRFAKKLTDQIVQPIHTLTQSAETILDGKINDFERIPALDRENNEITILVNAFNTMIEQIRTYIREIKENANAKVALHEKELENLKISNLLKRSELKELQM